MALPSGTVTFLFTDIEGSTKLAETYPETMPTLLARHHEILHRSIESHDGNVFRIFGDAFAAAFHTALDALKAALEAQRALANEPWIPAPIKVRMGIHTGVAQTGVLEERAGGYVGYLTLARAQRVMSIAHGGQILLSNATAELVRGGLPEHVSLRDLGEHRLRGLVNLEHLWQVLSPDLPADFPPLRSLNLIPNNLPGQLSSFIGREEEMAEIKQALAGHRLVTLTGAGGAGKSRISLQVASDSLDQFPDGIWFVELAPLAEPHLIPQTILTAARIPTPQGYTALESLFDFLREKTSLLVLDNCEHLIEACARLVDTLTKAAPNLKILASSREALGVRGEKAWRVPSLSMPDTKRPPSFEQLLQYESVRLFIDRALLVQPHFVVTKENAPAVARICRRLDGIPLAIELAAACLRTLTAEQIAVRLNDRFRLLTGGTRTELPRQQTLRALIDWSYNLLSEQEKILFRRLAVFAGGWTLEAAEAVCSSEGIEPQEILDLLTHLVDKSLVVIENDGKESRYRRLETIRQYARERLSESGEGAPIHTRHLIYFLEWVRDMEPGLRGPQQVELLKRLENEIDNIRAALEWSQESDPASGLQLASILKWFWHLCNLFEEGAGWLEKMLVSSNNSGTEIQPLLKARSLSVLAWLCFWEGNTQAALNHVKESLELCDNNKGPIADLITADNCYHIAISDADPGQAKLFAEKSLALHKSLDNKFGIAEACLPLFYVALYSGDLETASRWNKTGIAIRKELGDKDGLAYTLTIGAMIPLSLHDYESTKRMLEAAVEACKETRNEFVLGRALGYFGLTCLFEDNTEQAVDYFSQLVTLAHDKSNALLKTLGIYYFVLLFFKQKRFHTALRLIGAIEELKTYQIVIHLHDFREVQNVIQKHLREAREALGEVDFNAAFAGGRAMTLNQTTAYALKELGLS